MFPRLSVNVTWMVKETSTRALKLSLMNTYLQGQRKVNDGIYKDQRSTRISVINICKVNRPSIMACMKIKGNLRDLWSLICDQHLPGQWKLENGIHEDQRSPRLSVINTCKVNDRSMMAYEKMKDHLYDLWSKYIRSKKACRWNSWPFCDQHLQRQRKFADRIDEDQKVTWIICDQHL